MPVGACDRSVILARQALAALSRACCYISRKYRGREDIKTSKYATGKESMEFGHRASDGDGDPGSGDEDVLGSLTSVDRAWRALYREKRAHGYTKRRLVEIVKREVALKRKLVPVGGTVEGIECTLMMLEDVQATMVAMQEQHDVEARAQAQKLGEDFQREIDNHNELFKQSYRQELAKREKLQHELKELQQRSQMQDYRLHEADTAVLNGKAQYQHVLLELLASTREKERLMKELRHARKATILMASRQRAHTDAPQSFTYDPRRDSHEDKKRLFSEVEDIDVASAML